MDTPLLGSTRSVPPHSGHDVGDRPHRLCASSGLPQDPAQLTPLGGQRGSEPSGRPWVLGVPAQRGQESGRVSRAMLPTQLPSPLPSAHCQRQ